MRVLPVLVGTLLLAACANPGPQYSARTGTVGVVQPEPSAEIRDTQQRLQAMGLYHGPVDGLWGPETRAAVERYQQSRGLAVSGRIDEPTRVALRAPPPRPVHLADGTDVRTVQNRLRQLHFYSGPADGVWGSGTQAALENFQRARGLPVGQIDTTTMSAMGLDPAAFPSRTAAAPAIEPLTPGVVRGVQQRLRNQGFYAGAVDGVWGPRTEQAVARFQRARGIEPSGTLTPTTASALGMDPNNLSLTAVPR